MPNRLRVGVAALVHDHVWGELKRWRALPDVQIVAAGDVNGDLRQKAAGEYRVPRVYCSWQEMLEREELDIVQVASENSVCADIVEACAARGIHVISEKPMAATLAQANRMVRAAESAGITLLINWPNAWDPAMQEMERRIRAGEIGRINWFRRRSAHNGPREIGCDPHFVEWLYDEEKNGAGALMDYCCYGASLCAMYLGLPREVTGFRAALAKEYPVPDDNAVILMKYPHAFGIAEASWSQPVSYAAPNPVAYGSEGSLAVDGEVVILQRPGRKPETILPRPLKAPLRSGPEYLAHCLRTGEPVLGLCSPAVGRDAQEILEAGKRAADTGRTQRLPIQP